MNSSVEATPVGKRILAAAPSRGLGGDDAEQEPRDSIKTPADTDPSRGQALQEQVGRLEDEIDFLSHKLTEEETARTDNIHQNNAHDANAYIFLLPTLVA